MLPPRAYVFISLNVIRLLSIVGLLLVFSSSIVVMVNDIKAVNRFIDEGKQQQGPMMVTGNNSTEEFLVDCDYIEGSTVPNQAAGAFWAVLNRLLIIFQVIALLLSELGWPKTFFNRFFPVLGTDFGLGALGVIQCLIGAAVLSHHVDDFALVSAFFLFSIGCVNMLVGLIFREKAKEKRSILDWRRQAKNVLPTSTASKLNDAKIIVSSASSIASDVFGSKHSESNEKRGGYGWGRQGEKVANMKGFILQKPAESLPQYTRSTGSRASTPAPTSFASSATAL